MLFEMRLKIFNLRHNVAARARFTRCVVDFEALHMNIDDGLNPYIDIRIMHNVVLYIQIYNIYFNTYLISLYFFCSAIQIYWKAVKYVRNHIPEIFSLIFLDK